MVFFTFKVKICGIFDLVKFFYLKGKINTAPQMFYHEDLKKPATQKTPALAVIFLRKIQFP